jgi:hypothetical protein
VTARKKPNNAEPASGQRVMHLNDPSMKEGRLKAVGGSQADPFNNVIANQAFDSLWTKNSSQDWRSSQISAVAGALTGIGPKDELEGMLAAQLVAAHNAAMECYRRAMLHEQSFEGRKESLNQANKLSRTYSTLLEALNRHRGKGQQKISVEHVHVHAGGQAIVGAVETGGGAADGNQRQPHAKALSHAPVAPVWGEDQNREPLPLSRDAERQVPDARRRVAGSTEG